MLQCSTCWYNKALTGFLFGLLGAKVDTKLNHTKATFTHPVYVNTNDWILWNYILWILSAGTSGAAGGAENDSVDGWWVGGKLQISEGELAGW